MIRNHSTFLETVGTSLYHKYDLIYFSSYLPLLNPNTSMVLTYRSKWCFQSISCCFWISKKCVDMTSSSPFSVQSSWNHYGFQIIFGIKNWFEIGKISIYFLNLICNLGVLNPSSFSHFVSRKVYAFLRFKFRTQSIHLVRCLLNTSDLFSKQSQLLHRKHLKKVDIICVNDMVIEPS